MKINPLLCRLAILVIVWLSARQHCQAGFVYQVTVDTTSIENVEGSIEFQFSRAGSQGGTATIGNFSTAGGNLVDSTVFDATSDLSGQGSGTGTLPGPLTLTSGNLFYSALQDIDFGTSFSFDLTLEGPAFDNPDPLEGNSFSLFLYDARASSVLGGGSFNILLGGITGTALWIDSPAAPGGSPTVTDIGPGTTASVVPEPASFVSLSIGAATLGLYWFRQKRLRAIPRPDMK